MTISGGKEHEVPNFFGHISSSASLFSSTAAELYMDRSHLDSSLNDLDAGVSCTQNIFVSCVRSKVMDLLHFLSSHSYVARCQFYRFSSEMLHLFWPRNVQAECLLLSLKKNVQASFFFAL